MILNEEQQALADTLSALLRERSPVGAVRLLRKDPAANGFDAELWQQLVDMGLTLSALHEDNGGLGFGYTGLGAVFIELGRQLAATPLMSTVVLAAGLIEALAEPSQRDAQLAPLLSGQSLATLAHDEGTHFNGLNLTTQLHDHRLSGSKHMVTDGHVADTLLVSARDRQGHCCVVTVAADAPGVVVKRRSLMDGRNVASISFDEVSVPAAAVLGRGPEAEAALARVLDRATICASAEMLGAAEAVFGHTVEYLKVRKQFGVTIGSFQALQHRCANVFVELQLLRSQIMGALAAIDRNAPELTLIASQCKVNANEVMDLATAESVQLHGGIGVTEELDIGLYLKRTPVSRRLFGSTGFHLNRFATLSGF